MGQLVCAEVTIAAIFSFAMNHVIGNLCIIDIDINNCQTGGACAISYIRSCGTNDGTARIIVDRGHVEAAPS